ncbi:alpha/beta hydrolase [Cellvibrio sp. KY-YJ-3]|uniref:alpha/beta hydrolase n=1 Tax=Cellvibrio sp. KY-YJ-3 TaxID=454662 RepID=UPI0012477428|nr:alpha/beta hydrolase [Cellvibrio sp. KY-YJ-3]QEY11895.1 alpha/beta hydrolase [Cellvibrio sp. KY-YJ-3]
MQCKSGSNYGANQHSNFKGEAIFFSWPSKAFGEYGDDKIRANESDELLADFLQDVAIKNNKKIHIVAHSMGAYILMNSLTIINERINKTPNLLIARRNKNDGSIFSQIILAAPDIAQDEYREKFSTKNLSKLANNITLYSADNDWALKTSRLVNIPIEGTSQARLGDSTKEFFVVEGMDTIDTRKRIDAQIFGHSFYAEYSSLLSDIHMLLNYEASPDDRMLQKVIDSKGNALWFIREY